MLDAVLDELKYYMYLLAKCLEDELGEFVPWDEIHDYPEFPPGALGVPASRLPTSQRVRKWRFYTYGRS